jgi:hypothetical protein
MFLLGAGIGTVFGVMFMSILSVNSYEKGFYDGFNKGKRVNNL